MGAEFCLLLYYYLDLFPLATTDTNLVYSKEGAINILKNNPYSIRMEWGHWVRFGESARIWLYMPYAYFKRTPFHPEIIFSNYLFFTFTLVLIVLASWYYKKVILGLISVFVIGNSPFLIYEIYNNNNVFGLMATFSIFLLLIHLPIIFNSHLKWNILIPVLSGSSIALMHNIRAESTIMIISCILSYLLFNKGWLKKFLYISLFLFFYFTVNKSIIKYFNDKFTETTNIVKKHGGIPFTGGRTLVHPLWHPLLCGLGDYDNKYGFKLHDTCIYNKILPLLRNKTEESLDYPGESIYTMNEYYDSLHFYYKKPETINGYSEECKKMFVNTIKTDPLWYFKILLKRTRDFFFNLSPIGIFIINHLVEIPFSGTFAGLLSIMLWVFLWYMKEYRILFVLLFTLPLGFSVIMVYSAHNNSYQSVYHLLTWSLLIYTLCGYIYNKRKQLANYIGRFFQSYRK